MMFGLISKKRHEAEVAELRDRLATMRGSLARAHGDIADLRERFHTAQAELANWRAYGQMRDPKTGRLIAKVKQ